MQHTAESIRALAAAATNEDYKALNELQRRKKRQYAAQLVYHFLRAYERNNRQEYAGEINTADIRSALCVIARYGAFEDFATIGAPLAYFREQGRDKAQATFGDYCSFIEHASYDRSR